MRDTPRTDSAWETLPSVYEFIKEVKRMERELNAANAKIKRLEDAGDAILDAYRKDPDAMSFDDWICMTTDARNNWRKAKESNL